MFERNLSIIANFESLQVVVGVQLVKQKFGSRSSLGASGALRKTFFDGKPLEVIHLIWGGVSYNVD